MRAKNLNERGGGYPPGAEHDLDAPWNEKDEGRVIIKDDGAFIDIITEIQIDEDDWEETDKESVDPFDLNQYIAQKLGLDPKDAADKDLIEFEDIKDLDDDEYEITAKIKLNISLGELYDLANISSKRQQKYLKH